MFGLARVLHKTLPVPSHITPAVKNSQTVFVGKVVSTAMDKSVRVLVPRQKEFPKLRKTMWVFKSFMAHDEYELCRLGDTVQLRSCRPLSKRKKFLVDEILKQAEQFHADQMVDLDARIQEIAARQQQHQHQQQQQLQQPPRQGEQAVAQ